MESLQNKQDTKFRPCPILSNIDPKTTYLQIWTGSWCIVKEEENEQIEERRQQRKDANKKDNLIWEVWFPMVVNERSCFSDHGDQWSQPPCQDLVTAMSPSPALAGWLAGWDALPPLPRSPRSPPPRPISGHSQGRGWGMALSLSRPLSLTLLQVICIFDRKWWVPSPF